MEPLKTHTGVAVPLDAGNVDTDQIIPKQFLLAVDRKGFGKHLFHQARYLDEAETQSNPEFVLNKPIYEGGRFWSPARISGTARRANTPPGRFWTTASAS